MPRLLGYPKHGAAKTVYLLLSNLALCFPVHSSLDLQQRRFLELASHDFFQVDLPTLELDIICTVFLFTLLIFRRGFELMTTSNRLIDIRHRVRTTAFHEAGNTFAAVHFGIPFSKVWILKRTDYENRQGEILGELTRVTPIHIPNYVGKLEEAKAEATLAFCGPLAECLAFPNQLDPALQTDNLSDLKVAWSFLRFATKLSNPTTQGDLTLPDSYVEKLLNECGRIAEGVVDGNIAAITRIAEALLKKWELSSDDVREVIAIS